MSKTKNVVGGTRVYEDVELEILLEKDYCQTQEEVALTSGLIQQVTNYCLTNYEHQN